MVRSPSVREPAAFAVALTLASLLGASACDRSPRPAASSEPVRVAAASDLTLAFEQIGRDFQAETGQSISFSFASTGVLARQIQAGAPFDVFAAAHVSFVEDVVHGGVCDAATQVNYAHGRLALWTRAGSQSPPRELEELTDARYRKIAIANPDHAPYGRAARQALEQLGLWEELRPKLVFGESVRHAFQFAETGNVDAAIIALSHVARDRDNPWIEVPQELFPLLKQALVVCGRGKNRAGGVAFARFVASPRGRATLREFGLLPPEERSRTAP